MQSRCFPLYTGSCHSLGFTAPYWEAQASFTKEFPDACSPLCKMIDQESELSQVL